MSPSCFPGLETFLLFGPLEDIRSFGLHGDRLVKYEAYYLIKETTGIILRNGAAVANISPPVHRRTKKFLPRERESETRA